MMKYKGYVGKVEYDADAKIFHGEIIGLNDVITFQGNTVKDLEKAFKDSIDDYLQFCKEMGRKPEKSMSGNLHLRMTPELHSELYKEAAKHNQSLNTYIIEK